METVSKVDTDRNTNSRGAAIREKHLSLLNATYARAKINGPKNNYLNPLHRSAWKSVTRNKTEQFVQQIHRELVSKSWLKYSTNSMFLTDELTLSYIQNPKTVATPVRIRTDFAIKIWGFNRGLSYTLRYHQHEVFTCFQLLAVVTSACLPVRRKINFNRSSSLF